MNVVHVAIEGSFVVCPVPAMRTKFLLKLVYFGYFVLLATISIYHIPILQLARRALLAHVNDSFIDFHYHDELGANTVFGRLPKILLFPNIVNISCGLESTSKHLSGSYASDVIVVLKSRPNDFFLRQVIRETWGVILREKLNEPQGNGSSFENHAASINSAVKLESNNYEDILLLDFFDTYKNLSIKSLSILRWMTDYCTEPSFFFQGDCDIILFYDQLILFASENLDGKEPTIFGKCWNNARVGRKGKWKLSKMQYLPLVYPSYCSGAAFIMSKTVPKILMDAFNGSGETYLSVDDAYFTGILAQRAFVNRKQLGSILYKEDIKMSESQNGNLSCPPKHPMAVFEYKSSSSMRTGWKDLKKHFSRCYPLI